jgi:hypothetical protein
VWLPVALIAGVGAWTLLSGYAGKPAESGSVRLAAAVVAEPVPSPAVAPVLSAPSINPVTAEGEAIVPQETAVVDGLKISSQYWRGVGWGRMPWSPSPSATATITRSRTLRSPAPSAARTGAI